MIARCDKPLSDSIWYPADGSAAEMTQEYARYRLGMTSRTIALAEQVEAATKAAGLDRKPPPRRRPRRLLMLPTMEITGQPQRQACRQLARKKKRF